MRQPSELVECFWGRHPSDQYLSAPAGSESGAGWAGKRRGSAGTGQAKSPAASQHAAPAGPWGRRRVPQARSMSEYKEPARSRPEPQTMPLEPVAHEAEMCLRARARAASAGAVGQGGLRVAWMRPWAAAGSTRASATPRRKEQDQAAGPEPAPSCPGRLRWAHLGLAACLSAVQGGHRLTAPSGSRPWNWKTSLSAPRAALEYRGLSPQRTASAKALERACLPLPSRPASCPAAIAGPMQTRLREL